MEPMRFFPMILVGTVLALFVFALGERITDDHTENLAAIGLGIVFAACIELTSSHR